MSSSPAPAPTEDLLGGFVRHGAELSRKLVMALQDWIDRNSGSFSEAGVRDPVDRVRNELARARGRALMLPTVYR